MVKTPKAFREFFLVDLPKLQAELIAAAQTDFADWLESDEYLSLREQTRQRWLKAGIDIDRHPDGIGQLRLLIAKASPELLPATFRDGSWFWDSPPTEWFASLFEAAERTERDFRFEDWIDGPASDQTPVDAKRMADHVGVHPRTIRDALENCQRVADSSGRAPHEWNYSEAVVILRKIESGKLNGVQWPNSAAELSVPKHSSKIPARK